MASCTSTSESISRCSVADWQKVLADSVRSPSELCRMLGLDLALATEAEQTVDGFSLLAPRPYVARICPGDPDDPLLRQILPQAVELSAAAGYGPDPLAEADALCGPGMLRKYQGRLLILTTGVCAVHCRFCFRRHFRRTTPPPTADRLHETVRQLAQHREIHEVILSGGDPLMLGDSEIAAFLIGLDRLPHLKRVRLHTRLPIVIPQRVTGELTACLRETRLTATVVVHVNHPAEIDRDVAEGLGRLVDAGVPVLSQSVLLRGVNDRVEVLAELFERLIDLRVMPYYLHQLDAVAGAAHFEVSTAEGVALIAALRARLPGYAVPRYVRETRGGTSKQVLA